MTDGAGDGRDGAPATRRAPRLDRRRLLDADGASPVRVRSRLPARRRRLRDAAGARRPRRPSSPSTWRACAARPPVSTSSCRTTSPTRLATGSPSCWPPTGSTAPTGDASIRITVCRGPFGGRGLLPPDEAVRDGRDPGLARRAAAGGPARARAAPDRSSVRRDPASPLAALKTTSPRRLRLRPARGAPRRRRRCALPDAGRRAVRGHDREHVPGPPGPTATELATPALDVRDPGWHDANVAARWAAGRASGGRGAPHPADLAAADEAFLSSSVAGILPVTRFDGRPIGTGRPGRGRCGRGRHARR